MRIIAGEFRSRKLFTPDDDRVTRPIPDRVKESLFGLLRGHTEGAAVFDCFAGTGAIGLEALSRGAERCVFVERDKRIAEILRRNIALLGVDERAEVIVGDALGPGALARCPRPVTLAFFDPPYPLVRDSGNWARLRTQVQRVIDLLTDDGFLVLRTPHPFSLHIKDATHEAQKPERRGGKGRKGRWKEERRRARQGGDWEEVVGQTPEQIAARMDQQAAEDARRGPRPPAPESDPDAPAFPDDDQEPATPEPGITYETPDLSFENADGPETHYYHAMAVHLYARKKSAHAAAQHAEPD